jgi:NADP-dependent 3-hydroxy acid dehydrogenase YdfG
MNWKDKIIFLTGASSGIGEGIALALARKGATLLLVARRADVLRELASRCKSVGGDARVFALDVTDSDAVLRAVEQAIKEFGWIDVMIANAGISGTIDVQKMSAAEVTKVINTNLVGAVNATSAILPKMLERGEGQLVAISSLAGYRGLPKSSAYCASKAGMIAFFESIRLDVRKRGIAVTIISPGFIKTPLTAGRHHKMPFLMELNDAIPLFIRAIEKKKKFAAFPWQLATIARAGKYMPAWIYDRIASRRNYRE